MEWIKICRVCGDKAHAFNFSGQSPTCHSCRVFFYRNVHKHEKLKCLKKNNCSLDFVTRKCCAKCRLTRCFEIGMKLKSNKIAPKIKSFEHEFNIDATLVDILKANIHVKAPLFCVDTNKKDKFQKMPKINLTFISNSLKLNQYELQQIDEIRSYSTHFPEENELEVASVEMTCAQSFNLSSFYARRGVKYCKLIPLFKSLNQDEQLRLLKPCMFDSMTIRAAFFYNREKDTYLLLENEQGTKAVEVKCWCTELEQNWQLAEQNKQLTAILNEEMENDITIRAMLTIISLVKPSKEIFPESVRYQYYVYCHLFRRYLENKYQCAEKAEKKYTTLLKILFTDFAVMKENLRLILLEIGIDNLAEIIVETLNLQDLLKEH